MSAFEKQRHRTVPAEMGAKQPWPELAYAAGPLCAANDQKRTFAQMEAVV